MAFTVVRAWVRACQAPAQVHVLLVGAPGPHRLASGSLDMTSFKDLICMTSNVLNNIFNK